MMGAFRFRDRWRTWWLLVLMWMIPPAASSQVIRDSAGVTIVENAAPRWNRGAEWVIASTPYMSIGDGAKGPEYEFSGILGLVVTSDRRVVITDLKSQQLRFYDSTGNFLGAVGRRGRGPGEYLLFEWLLLMSGDSLIVTDGSQRRMTLLGPTGKYVRSSIMHSATIGPAEWIEFALRFDDGGLMGYTDSFIGFAPVDSLGQTDPTNAARRIVVRAPGRPAKRDTTTIAEFAPRLEGEIRGNRFYVGFGDRFEIQVYSSKGRLERIIRRKWTPRRVTPSDLTQYKKAYFDRPDSPYGEGGVSGESLRERNFRMTRFAKTYPAFDRIRVDAVGNIWLRQPEWWFGLIDGKAPIRWTVFDPNGIWLGDVTMPTIIGGLKFIGNNYVVTIERDPNTDVPSARFYRLIKRPSEERR